MEQEVIKEIRAENTGSIVNPEESPLLEISGLEISNIEQGDVWDSPKLLRWPIYIPLEEESTHLLLPERLTNPQYGGTELEENLKEMAKRAPGIHKIWEMTKDLPSLTKILLEEREQE